jgi:dTDP-4-dehydrorhamnose 3,5-epimerase
MSFQEMKIQGAFVHTPIRHDDNRGHFEEQFKHSLLEKELGRSFPVRQVNQSVSQKGVIRGIHWTDSEEGQAKYVSCTSGAIWDVVVDLRKDSPTYGQWEAEIISAANGKSVFIPEGLGHVLMALEASTVVNYLCTTEFNPQADKTINPLDQTLAIGFDQIAKAHGIDSYLLSDKDSQARPF